jgi:hypothetical protein
LGFFIVAAANLPFLAAGGTNTDLLLFAIIDYRIRHPYSLPVRKLLSIPPDYEDPFRIRYQTWNQLSQTPSARITGTFFPVNPRYHIYVYYRLNKEFL